MEWNELLNEDRRRPPAGPSSNELRTEFERDYDRSVFSTPVRRLRDKAQVFPLEPHDAVRTRLTHSLEVSTVARDIANHISYWLREEWQLPDSQARCIPTIAATCGLLHDIGNPPFGHAGELAISTWFHKQFPGNNGFTEFARTMIGTNTALSATQLASDFWKFEGNAQTLRLVSKLQVMDDLNGLNLTYGTLSALCKYTASSHQTSKSQQENKKPGYFTSETDVITDIRANTGTGASRNPITYLVEASDDIVYSVVDIEDGIKKGVVAWAEVNDYFAQIDCPITNECLLQANERNDDEIKAQMFRVIGILQMVPAVIKTFKQRYEVIMAGGYHDELINDCDATLFVRGCKDFARERVYPNKETLRLEVMGRFVIHELMDIFAEGASDPEMGKSVAEFAGKLHKTMSNNYRKVYYDALDNLPMRYCEHQLLTDYICGMTDTFACNLHKQLTNG